MEIVVLGDSDSSGEHTGGTSWVHLLGADLRQSGIDANVRSIGFSAVPVSAPDYAERRVGELKPDVVIVMVGAWGFTYTMVQLQVEALFGARVKGWYVWLEHRFESRTRTPAVEPPMLNRFARKAVRQLIGARAQISREQLTERYREVFRRLARFEDTDVIAMTYQGIGDHVEVGNMPAQRRRFFAEVRRAAEEHHYGWVHEPELFADLPNWRDYAIDELHFNVLGHRRILGTIAPKVHAQAAEPV
jgi:lysophospholipase L1-like esterase